MTSTITRIFTTFLICGLSLQAQQQTAQGRKFIRGTGQASISINPDLARIDVGVVTDAATAQDASTQNAARASAVIGALTALLGPNADVKTVNYTLSPRYSYANNTSTLTGYTATNVVEVNTGDLPSVGKIIDAATQAGANTIQSLQFTLKNDSQARADALRAAAIQARQHVDAIASGLGIHTGSVLAAIEGSSAVFSQNVGISAAAAPATPIEPGTVKITAVVTLDVENLQ